MKMVVVEWRQISVPSANIVFVGNKALSALDRDKRMGVLATAFFRDDS